MYAREATSYKEMGILNIKTFHKHVFKFGQVVGCEKKEGNTAGKNMFRKNHRVYHILTQEPRIIELKCSLSTHKT